SQDAPGGCFAAYYPGECPPMGTAPDWRRSLAKRPPPKTKRTIGKTRHVMQSAAPQDRGKAMGLRASRPLRCRRRSTVDALDYPPRGEPERLASYHASRVLLDLKHCGLSMPPQLAAADGARLLEWPKNGETAGRE